MQAILPGSERGAILKMAEQGKEALLTFVFWAMDVIRDQFDKLLLCWLLMYMTALVVFARVDQESVHWLRELTSGVLGALLGLITGVKIGQGMVRVNPPTNLPDRGPSPKQISTLTDTTIKEETKSE